MLLLGKKGLQEILQKFDFIDHHVLQVCQVLQLCKALPTGNVRSIVSGVQEEKLRRQSYLQDLLLTYLLLITYLLIITYLQVYLQDLFLKVLGKWEDTKMEAAEQHPAGIHRYQHRAVPAPGMVLPCPFMSCDPQGSNSRDPVRTLGQIHGGKNPNLVALSEAHPFSEMMEEVTKLKNQFCNSDFS